MATKLERRSDILEHIKEQIAELRSQAKLTVRERQKLDRLNALRKTHESLVEKAKEYTNVHRKTLHTREVRRRRHETEMAEEQKRKAPTRRPFTYRPPRDDWATAREAMEEKKSQAAEEENKPKIGNSTLLTQRQFEATRMMTLSPARHVCLVGGARSGKTVALVRATFIRALRYEMSLHVILRYRAAATWPSIGLQTVPFVLRTFFPGMHVKEHTGVGMFELDNGSQVWLGGLDDKERADKILGKEYCVDPRSLVLTADLKWVFARDLVAGQQLIGFDEELEGHQILRRSVVTSTSIINAPRYLIRTTKGTTVVSAGHQFVAYFDDRRGPSRARFRVNKNFRSLSWKRADELKVGDAIRFAIKPWEEGRSYEDGWLAGIYDGEGDVGGHVGFAQKPGFVAERTKDILARKGIRCNIYPPKEDGCEHIGTSGLWMGMKLLGSVRPIRLLAQSDKLWENRRGFIGRAGKTGRGSSPDTMDMDGIHCAQVTEIEYLGEGPVVALGTSTKTFIADGFLGHNSTIYFNECSQIPYSSVLIALSRLAQVVPGLRQRAFYDLNPGPMGHWTNQLFGELRDPVSRAAVDKDDYIRMFLNPRDNAQNLDPKYIESLEKLPEKARKRFLEGIYQDETADALWTQRMIEDTRITPSQMPQMVKIIVAVDPSGVESDLDDKHDAVGIVVVGLGQDGHGYVLNDCTMHGSPEQWGSKVVSQYRFYKANGVVGEINYGGAMVEYVIRSIDKTIPFISVTASRGKVVRSQPAAALYGQRMVHHVGFFPEMEEEMCAFTDFGYVGERSPNRADALVWALTELMLEESETGWVQFYNKQLAKDKTRKDQIDALSNRELRDKIEKGLEGSEFKVVPQETFKGNPPPPPPTHQILRAPSPHAAFYAAGTDGTAKRVTADQDGMIVAELVYVTSLLNAGCQKVG